MRLLIAALMCSLLVTPGYAHVLQDAALVRSETAPASADETIIDDDAARDAAITDARKRQDWKELATLLAAKAAPLCVNEGAATAQCSAARLSLGEALLNAGSFVEGASVLAGARAAMEMRPETPLNEQMRVLGLLAASYKAQGQHADEREALIALIPLIDPATQPAEPILAAIWTEIANSYAGSDEAEERAKALAKAETYAAVAATFVSEASLEADITAADALLRAGQLTEARDLLTTAVASARRSLGSANMTTGQLLLRLGESHIGLGETAAAQSALRQSITSFDTSLRHWRDYDRAVTLLVALLTDDGRLNEAEALLKAQLPSAVSGNDHAMAILRIAEAQIRQGRFADAAKLLDPLPAEIKSGRFVIQPGLYGLVQRQRARIARAAGDWIAAEQLIEDGLSFGPTVMPEADVISDWALWAQSEGKQGKRPDATEKFEATLTRIREKRLERVATEAVVEAKFLAGQFFGEDPSQGERALTLLVEAFMGAELLRIDAGADEVSQQNLLRREAQFRPLFLSMADQYHAAWSMARAESKKRSDGAIGFTLLQRAMMGTTARATALSIGRSVTGELGEQLQQAEAAVFQAERALTSSLSFADYNTAAARTMQETELTALRARRDALQNAIANKYPDYFNLIRPANVGVPAIQAHLSETEAMLVAVPSPDGVHIIALTRDRLFWHKANVPQAALETDIRRLLWFAGASVDGTALEQLSWEEEVPGTNAFDRKTAHRLYQQLIAPVLPTLAGKTHLFVTGGGALSRLPFSILVSAAPEGADDDAAALRDTRWLADDFALIHLPSVQTFYLQRTTMRPPVGNLLPFAGVGDPALDGPPSRRAKRGAPAVAVSALRKLEQLPGTAAELQAVSARYGKDAMLMLRADATEPAVMAAPLGRFRILSFATHALMAGEVGGAREAGLVLSPPAESTADNDGYLAMSEIAALRLNADWVILSACNSAGGDGSVGATGLSGLARAFLFAGAQNLLASHWPVLDAAAPPLIIDTLDPAQDGDRAAALQRAMRTMRHRPGFEESGNSYSHPRVWAPFVLIGDWR